VERGLRPQQGLRWTQKILLKSGWLGTRILHSPRSISPLWYKSRQGIKNHRSETARRRSRDPRAIIIDAAFCVSGFSVCFLAGQQAFGQITTSDIVGSVSDATGAVVVNAKVAVTIKATGDSCKQLRRASTLRAPGWLRARSKDTGTRRWGTCSRKLIPRRGKRCFISTKRTCWNKA
jgi:hypothetical protein